MNTGHLRLLHLREQTEAAGEAMADERQRFERIKGSEPTRAIAAFNLFQTPEPVAALMAERLAGLVKADARILEPSAGLGRLCRAARNAGLCGPMVWVESDAKCAAELFRTSQGARLVQADFLACDVERLGGLFDGVLMNPPFKLGTDVKHIAHARKMLQPGGALIALCYDGVKQRRDIMPIVDSWEPLPAQSFKSEGTRADVVMVTIQS